MNHTPTPPAPTTEPPPLLAPLVRAAGQAVGSARARMQKALLAQHRMGAAQIADKLPPLLEAMRRDGRRVLWICDPMHGNTESTTNGYKTRRFRNIRSELELSLDLHAAAGTRLGGVHLELTGEDVTECLGGARELTESDLERAYHSTVDPRLNYEQALEVAMLIVRKQEQISAPV